MSPLLGRILLVTLALWPTITLAAGHQPPQAPPDPLVNPSRMDPHRVPRAASPITVDGVLDEPAWQSALKLELPYEVWPGENLKSDVATEALLTFDEAHVYAAFRAHDPDPDAVRARLSDRDAAFQDDFVGIVVDTFNDERRAFEFFVNALGVQMDLTMDDVGGNEDSSWDAIWNSAGRLTSGGYEVEIAIPYTSLRFQRGEGEQVWGLDLIRIHPRDRRRLFAMNQRDRNVNCYLCQVGKIVGFEGATPGKNLEITPTLTALRTDRIEEPDPNLMAGDPDQDLTAGDPDYEAGVTARWGITPNLALSGTINPDFSHVEADVAQLDVNEQFALFFPEKRPFFLEGADLFDTPFPVVHTRTMADLDWGIKQTGKIGRHALGAFVLEEKPTERPDLLIPGSQGSASTFHGEEEVTAGVLRYRRDVGKNSALGALLTAREGDEYHNRVFGADALLRPSSTDTIRLQALGSQTRYPEPIATAFAQGTDELVGTALTLNYFHSTRKWAAWTRYRDIGPDFRADLGFLPQVDIRVPLAGAEYYWLGDPNDWYSRIQVGGDWDQTTDYGGRLIEREVEAWTTVAGPKQLFLFLGGGHRLRGFRDEIFDQGFVNLFFEIQPIGDLQLALEGGYSKRIDFAFFDPKREMFARQGDELRFGPSLRYDVGRRVRLNVSYETRHLGIDEGQLFRAHLTQMRLAFQLNLRTFFRANVQSADVTRDVSHYPPCTDPTLTCPLNPKERTLFTQLLFSYKINPQTVLFLGYSDNHLGFDDGTQETDLTRTDRSFFFKVGYAWVL